MFQSRHGALQCSLLQRAWRWFPSRVRFRLDRANTLRCPVARPVASPLYQNWSCCQSVSRHGVQGHNLLPTTAKFHNVAPDHGNLNRGIALKKIKDFSRKNETRSGIFSSTNLTIDTEIQNRKNSRCKNNTVHYNLQQCHEKRKEQIRQKMWLEKQCFGSGWLLNPHYERPPRPGCRRWKPQKNGHHKWRPNWESKSAKVGNVFKKPQKLF